MINNNISDIIIREIHETKFDQHSILNFLKSVDDDFYPSLSSIIDLYLWANKLFDRAYNLVAYDLKSENKIIIAMLSFYCNDYEKKYSYIPVLGVVKEYRKNGLAKIMFAECFKVLKIMNIATIGIRTWSGSAAYNLYNSVGFIEKHRIKDRPNDVYTVYLERLI